MKPQKVKFIGGGAVILGVFLWIGFTGYEEGKTYYVTLTELRTEGEHTGSARLRVAGDVLPGSIRRQSRRVSFTLQQGEDKLEVVYVGEEALPDTLVDDAQAVVIGSLGGDNVFEASQVQAKCASKYEALPPGVEPDSDTAY